MNKRADDLEGTIDFQAMVAEKMNSFDLERLETIILSLSKRELKHIEWLGGVLGGVIGILQALILLVYSRV